MFLLRADFLLKIFVMMMLIAGLVLGGFAGTSPSEAARRSRYYFKDVERCMMKKINNRRLKHGRRKLEWDRQLGFVARRHAQRMARHGAIFHDGGLGNKVTRWRRLGDNVGSSHRGCKRLFKAFWRSSSHRHNILGHWRFMGVGSEKRHGRLYVNHVFESRRNPGNIYTFP